MDTIISILTRFVADTVWCCTDSPRVVDTFPIGNVMTLALTREPGRATWITRRDYEFNGSPLYWHRTAYDAEGRQTETEDSLTSTRQWFYNRRSELVGASGTQTHSYDYAYSYDSAGNRLTASDGSGAIPYTSNELNQYTSLYLRGETLLYDADGNLTQDNSRDFAYSYDDENRLVSVTPANPVYGSRAIENVYDHRSRRIKKIVRHYDGSGMGWNVESTHVFVWDGWNIVLEQITFADNTTSTIEYFWGNDLSGTEQGAGGVGGLLATRIDGVFYIPVYGANGNIMMYVGETGAIAAQFDYDPYGNILQTTGPLASQLSFGFSTKYHDREVGLVAYQLRTYNPVYGRWLNRDPIGERGGENLYGFVGNCPQFKVDMFGENVFSSAFPPLGGYNAPPYVVRQPESIDTSCHTLLDDKRELERILLSWCPRNGEKYRTKWRNGGVCCPGLCRKQARAIAKEIYREISVRQTYFQGCVGNVMGLFDKSLGIGCVDWQTHVQRACKNALEDYDPKCRCFYPVKKELFFLWPFFEHNWIDIVTPLGDGHIYVDPWPTGGRRLLLY